MWHQVTAPDSVVPHQLPGSPRVVCWCESEAPQLALRRTSTARGSVV